MSVSRFAQWHWSLGSLCVHAVCFPRAEEGAIPSSETCANMGHQWQLNGSLKAKNML